jgi:hypothetical protein
VGVALASGYFHLSPKISVYFIEARKIADKAILASSRADALWLEVTALEQSLIPDYRCSHRTILVGSGAEQ